MNEWKWNDSQKNQAKTVDAGKKLEFRVITDHLDIKHTHLTQPINTNTNTIKQKKHNNECAHHLTFTEATLPWTP